MSNQNQNPIRVADLAEAIYVPRKPLDETAKAYSAGSKPRVSKGLDETESQYVWSKSSSHLEVNALAAVTGIETLAHQLGPIEARVEVPVNRQTERSALAEMRDHFARESEQNVAVLKPVTIDEIQAESETDSSGVDYFEEWDRLPACHFQSDRLEAYPTVFSSPAKIESPETAQVWGLDYHIVDMEQTLDFLEQVIYARKPSYAVTANLNYAMLCANNHRLAEFTRDSVLTLCDGMPVLWRSKLNSSPLPERVAGADLIFRLAERCANKKFRVYFYGACEGVAEKAAAALKNLYPKLIVAGVQCPPFRDCSFEETQSQIARIKQTKPDLLFVALGQPKGEFWIEDHLEELGIPLTIQLGASFDFVAGNTTRAPKLMQKLGMEWLHRTLKDPIRLAPRYFKNLFFLVNAVRQELIDKLS